METKDPKREAEIEKLVVESQRGNSDAFGKLYDLFVDMIFRYMHYRVGKQDSEDLTELVFLKTWEHIRKYRREAGTFSSWIFRIAHNIVVDHYRANQFQNVELTENIQDYRSLANTVERTHRILDQEVLALAMKELKDHYRQILILKYMNDLSNEEIGSVMGKSQAALRILQFRALRSLRRILENKNVKGFE